MSEVPGSKKKLRIIQLDLVKEISHGVCVSNLTRLVARKLELPEKKCYDLAVAGFLHDVGKLRLNHYVRGNEKETLVVEELRYVRMHAGIGSQILREQGYPEEMTRWVYCHHENCDGSGYPGNLTREEIPLEARIIRVCDVFAALTADRSYRKAFDAKTAVDLMIEEAKIYDIRVFLAFLDVIHEEDLDKLLDNQTQREYLGRFFTREEKPDIEKHEQ